MTPDPHDGATGAITPESVRAGLDDVRARIEAAGGDPAHVAILAVTKGHGSEAVDAALQAGVRDLGENYAQELRDKAERVAPDPDGPSPSWHFIGRLQSNKVRTIAPLVACWQSVDRQSLVDEIARRAPGATVLIQVNAGDESHKGGCPVVDVAGLVDRALEQGLAVDGLMTVGVADDRTATAASFETVRGLVDDLGLRQCSMGMSADLDLAVAAGSTMVRVGTAVFGARSPR